MIESVVILLVHYRKVRCPECGIRVEYHDFVAPYARYTHRLARLVFQLCQYMTVTDVAEVLHLSWHQVKEIDKSELGKRFSNPDYSNLRILSVDEISLRKHHNYLTIVCNFETGQVIGVVQNRDSRSLAGFLKTLPREVREHIDAVAMDMWDPYIKAIQECCPDSAIVFDLFHVTAAFSRLIDKVRNMEFQKADPQLKTLMKKSRFLLLKNPQNLRSHERPRLRAILKHNESLALLYILKDYLKRLWQYQYRASAKRFLTYWCQLARQSGIEPLVKFVKMLQHYSYGILNHCKYPIHTGKLEGINNKIKVIKRKAYGYNDMQYFALKIMAATATNS
jgi:transposase